jgi:LmbE family N-acetylglucosaminyl deacetylase
LPIDSRRKHVLFVLAHQDDEVMISPRLAREAEAGHRVHCVFLTNGRGVRGVPPAVRDEESSRILASLGVTRADVHFAGTARDIDDLRLIDHLDEALGLLEDAVGSQPIRRIFTLAWEGGHPDHDAVHAIALAFAARRGLLGRTWQFPAYHGRNLPWKLFRVVTPLQRGTRRFQRRLRPGEALRHSLLCWRYASQRRSWLGLFPELAVQRGLRRREVLDAVDLRALLRPPHEGALLYERLFGASWSRVGARVASFASTHFDAPSRGGAPSQS